jgi:hypothetical protein
MHNRIATYVPALLAGLFFSVSSIANAGVTRHGSPFIPSGANFSITALQGINGSPLGGTGSPEVNTDFEFTPSIGVTIDQGGGKKKDFGIGLYEDSAHNIQSTGLEVLFNQPILASTATATVEDFDIQAGKDTFFKTNKVEPRLLLLGPGNSILGSATPADIFPNLVPVSGPAKDDTWNINFAGLINTLHLADTPINGFVLFADTAAGERPSSDPYLLIAVGGPAVPEPSTGLLLIVSGALATLFHSRRPFLKR